jgi:porin
MKRVIESLAGKVLLLLSRVMLAAPLLAIVMTSALGQTASLEQSPPSASGSDQDPAPQSSQADWSERTYLTGNWGGVRSSLADKGVDVDLRHTSFYQGLTSGTGEDNFEYGGKFDLFIDLDGHRMGLWEGSGLSAHVEYSHGDLETNLGGTLFATNTALYFPVGTPEEVVATSLKYSQKVGEKTSISIGKFNPVDVYATHPFHGGWGIDRFMNIVPVAPPSGLIPVVFMGVLTNIMTEPVNWTIIISDPNDRTNDYFPGDLFEDGVLSAVNATYFTTLAGRKTSFGITGLYSTAEGVDYSSIGGGLVETSNKSGAYNVNIQFRHDLQQGGGQAEEAWGFFFKAGIADGNPNYVKSSLITGFGGRALFLGRPQDSFGLGAFYYNLSDVLEDSINPAAVLGDEAAIELFYNYSITPWLYLGLDVQYVKPARERFDNALAMGLRMQVRF